MYLFITIFNFSATFCGSKNDSASNLIYIGRKKLHFRFLAQSFWILEALLAPQGGSELKKGVVSDELIFY